MCISLKESTIAFAVILFIVIILWIRNYHLDRVIAAVLFAVSLIQLAEIFFYLGYDPSAVGRSIFLILWFQTLILAIAMYCYYQTTLTLAWLVIFGAIFLIAVIYSVKSKFGVAKGSSGHVVWDRNGGPILGNWSWLYLAGIFIPFLIIQYYAGWKDIGIWILFAVLVISAIVVYFVYPKVSFASMWCYSAVFIAATAYLIGAFPKPCVM